PTVPARGGPAGPRRGDGMKKRERAPRRAPTTAVSALCSSTRTTRTRSLGSSKEVAVPVRLDREGNAVVAEPDVARAAEHLLQSFRKGPGDGRGRDDWNDQ